MKLEGTEVRHSRFGTGRVLRCNGAMLCVAFPEAGEKQFLFPDAFEHFLKAGDPVCAAEIAEQIILKKAEEEAVRREQEARQQALAAVQEAAKAKPKRAASHKKKA